MALAATIYWEVRTTGSDTNGGGFKTGATGTDRSQQDAAHATLTAASVVHSTTSQITVAGYTVTAADVGNLVQIAGGTATAGFYEITAVDVPNNRWTVDRAVGTAGQTCPGKMGGALASLGKVGGAGLVSGQRIYLKAGTYLVTSATVNVAGGCFSATASFHIEGYQTTRGDRGTKPLLQASGITTFTLILQAANVPSTILNLKVDGAGLASGTGIGSRGVVYLCEAVNFTQTAFTLASTICTYVHCTVSGCSGAGFTNVNCVNCVATNNTGLPFNMSSETWLINCIADSNSGAAVDGFNFSGNKGYAVNCTSYNNGRDGFRVVVGRGTILINCIAEDNAAWGYNCQGDGILLHTCAGFSNASGETTFTAANSWAIGYLTGGGSFFTDAPGGDFSLNATVGAGALLRAAGLPGLFPGVPTTSYLDVGAAQHQDGGGGGGGGAHAYPFVGMPG